MIYEVRSGAGTIQLLTLKPEELDEEITKKFEVLGIDIPDMKYVTYHNVYCRLGLIGIHTPTAFSGNSLL